MNWKLSFLGLVVLLLGAGAALALSGAFEDETTTVVEQVVTEPTTAETTAGSTGIATTTTAPEATTTGEGTSLSELAEEQPLIESDSVTFKAASQIDDPISLGGHDIADPALVTLGTDIYELVDGPPWRLEVPVTGYSRLHIASAGLAPSVSADTDFELALYADDTESQPLWGPKLFEGPATIDEIDTDLNGASTLIFEWSSELWGGTPKTTKFEAEAAKFVLGDAQLTE
jgi:hypothetical protein